MNEEADEPNVPRAALNKLIKDAAGGVRVSNEARDLVHACCLDFVKAVAAQANRLCVAEQKKTISQDHALAGGHFRCSTIL